MLADIDSTRPDPRHDNIWIVWVTGAIAFLLPLLLLLGAERAPATWNLRGEVGTGVKRATFAISEGLAILYRWSAIGVERSVDDGRTWTHVGQGLPVSRVSGLNLIDLVPGNGRTLYALAGPPERYGLYRSDNNGTDFELLFRPLDFVPEMIAVKPGSDGDRVYLAGGDTLMVSFDSGVTWQTHRLPQPITLLYAGSALWVGGDGWLATAADDDLAWQMRTLPQPTAVQNLSVPNRQPQQVYVVQDQGLWRSQDQGLSWQSLPVPTSAPITSVTIDPVVWQTLYVGDASGRIWRSDDWGINWRLIPGPIAGPVYQIFQQPGERSRLFITAGQQLWQTNQTVPEPTATTIAPDSPALAATPALP